MKRGSGKNRKTTPHCYFMPELITLKKNNQFKRLYSKGKQFVSPLLIIYCAKNRTGEIRYGITASKKIGCAVERNRARRIIREAYRSLYPRISKGFDIVFIARGKTTRSSTGEVIGIMEKQLIQAGIIK